VSVQRAGALLQEVWDDGRAFRTLNDRTHAVAAAKDAAETQRKVVKRKLPLPGAAAATAAAEGSGAAEDAALLQAEFVLSEEVHKVRMAAVKREEDAISRERELLDREKVNPKP
jgi:tousled-like kinase